MNKTDIVIIGSGWYGLHILKYLEENYNNFKTILLEKNSQIFENSSNYNQNRLHLGYHYPRSYYTRELCKNGYDKFIEKYREVVDFIDNNYYLISNDSIIDYNSYLKIYSNDKKYDHTIIENTYFKNVDNNIINTKEKIINSLKSKEYFLKNINLNNLKLNYYVKNIEKCGDKIIINNDIECKLLIDCTYNQLNLSKNNYNYELTISLIYEKTCSTFFDSLTIMDGNFFSLYPRDISKEKYTLTHVSLTPIIKSSNLYDVLNYKITDDTVNNIKKNMEKDVINYYQEFKNNFTYVDYFISYKCKLKCNNDKRECNIENNNNIISVNCGKITGIFEFEEYIKKFLKQHPNFI